MAWLLTGATRLAALSIASLLGAAVAAACAAGGGEGDDVGFGGSTTTTTNPSSTGSGQGGAGGSTASGGGGAIGPCDEDPCKLTLPQCGCGAGDKCTLDAQGGRLCVPDGTVDPGGECNGNCKAGSLCLSIGTLSTCHEFCAGDGDCDAPGGLCVMKLEDGNGGTYPEMFCSDNCDPVSATGCTAAGAKCDAGLDSGPPERWFTLCAPAGAGTQGASCATNGFADCASGFGCFNVTDQNQNVQELCLQYCKVSASVCPSPTVCQSLPTPMVIGTIEYGACL